MAVQSEPDFQARDRVRSGARGDAGCGRAHDGDEISLALYRSKGVQEPSREAMRHMWGAVGRRCCTVSDMIPLFRDRHLLGLAKTKVEIAERVSPFREGGAKTRGRDL